MDPIPSRSRTLIRSSAAGVVLSALTTAATFTSLATEITFLRYPLFGAAIVTLVIAGWRSDRLPEFNRTLWAYAPLWARLSWLAILAAAMAAFATISLVEELPTVPEAQRVLETRGIGAIAAYIFLITGLRSNVDLSLANGEGDMTKVRKWPEAG